MMRVVKHFVVCIVYPSCQTSRHGVYKLAHAMFDNYFRMIHELVHGVVVATDVVFLRIERVPVVHVIELHMDTVVIVVTISK